MIAALLILCLSISFVGCGNADEAAATAGEKESVSSVKSSNEELSEYTYVADYLPVNLDNCYQYQFADGKVYSTESGSDSYTNLICMDAATGDILFRTDMASKFPAPEEMTDNSFYYAGVNNYQVMPDGTILCVLNSTLYQGDDWELVSQNFELATLDQQGQIVSSVDMTQIVDLEDDYINHLTSDRDGNTILITGKYILRLHADGTAFDSINLNEDNWVSSVVKLNDEPLVMMYDEEWNMKAYRMDFDEGTLEEAYTGFSNNTSYFFAGNNGSILELSSTDLRRRNVEDESSEVILKWTDCDIMGDCVQSVSENEDGTFSVIIYDWNGDTTELASLHLVKRSEIAEVQEITIASLYEDQSLSRNVVNFNKNQKQYHANIVTYYDYESGMSYDDAYTAFNNALTGSNPPDLVVLDNVDQETFASKNLLEDLQPYLDKSPTLAQDYEDYILDCNRYNGMLLAIPTRVNIDTLVVSSDLIGGEKQGWTIDEFLDLLEAHPEASALEYTSRTYLLSYFLCFALDGLVDWDNGTCNFDSPTFKRILEYLATQPEDPVWDDNDMRSSAGKIADGDVLLLSTSLYDPSEVQVNDAVMGGKAVYIGYPTLDGTPTANLSAYGGYGMLSTSSNKDAAWKFIEFSTSANDVFYAGLPARTSERNHLIEEYLNGEKNIEGNGVGWGDDFTYTYHNVTKEEVELFEQVLATGRVRSNKNDKILDMIYEEAQAFYAGQKSVDEVTQIIQSRVSLYVNENK